MGKHAVHTSPNCHTLFMPVSAITMCHSTCKYFPSNNKSIIWINPFKSFAFTGGNATAVANCCWPHHSKNSKTSWCRWTIRFGYQKLSFTMSSGSFQVRVHMCDISTTAICLCLFCSNLPSRVLFCCKTSLVRQSKRHLANRPALGTG